MKKLTSKKRGFTIVELVIVIAVIAILAAVLIPTFTNVVQSAKNSAVQMDLRNAYSQYVVEVTDAEKSPVGNDKLLFKYSVNGSDVYYKYSNGKYIVVTAGENSKYTVDTTGYALYPDTNPTDETTYWTKYTFTDGNSGQVAIYEAIKYDAE